MSSPAKASKGNVIASPRQASSHEVIPEAMPRTQGELTMRHFIAILTLALLAIAAPAQTAWEAIQQGDLDTAIAICRDDLTDNPNDNQARTNLARALMEIGSSEAAITELYTVLEKEPERASALNLLGRVQARQGSPEAALDAFAAAATAASDNAWYQNNYGFTLMRMDMPADAVEPLRRATEIDPASALFMNNLGVALRESGDTEGARSAFEETLRIYPEHPQAKANLDSLP